MSMIVLAGESWCRRLRGVCVVGRARPPPKQARNFPRSRAPLDRQTSSANISFLARTLLGLPLVVVAMLGGDTSRQPEAMSPPCVSATAESMQQLTVADNAEEAMNEQHASTCETTKETKPARKDAASRETRQGRKLFVGGLSPDTHERDLQASTQRTY